MTIGIIEVEATAAIEAIYLAWARAVEFDVIFDACPLDAGKYRVEFRLADQERAVLRLEILCLGEVEGDAVAEADGNEMRPLPSRLQSQDFREEPRMPIGLSPRW